MTNKLYIMKQAFIGLFVVSLFVACGGSSEEIMPEDLEGLKAVLKEKKTELSELQGEIEEITAKVAEMDPSLQEKAKLVDTLTIGKEKFDRYIEIQGIVTSDDVVNVVSEVPGRITSMTVKEGNRVSKGQLIATLDLESLDKQVAEIETSLVLVRDVFERQERLWNQKIGSEVQYLQAKNNVERLEKSLETLAFQKTKANVYAPISGVVDMEFMKQGEVANPGMPIVQILNTSKVKVTTDLPEQYITIARKGQMVDLYFPSIDMEMKGRVTLLGRSIDPANRTLQLEITPSKRSSLLKPNLLAEIKVKELTIDDAISIPLAYILQEVDGTEFVYIVGKDGNDTRARKKYITTGESATGNVIVTEGLTENDIVIGQGARNVSDGQLIKLN